VNRLVRLGCRGMLFPRVVSAVWRLGECFGALDMMAIKMLNHSAIEIAVSLLVVWHSCRWA
jgi:hypothetical protein